MAIREILLLGNPRLFLHSGPVQAEELPAMLAVANDLRDTMLDFHVRHGWGRAIAAPQIGTFKRIIYLQVDKPMLIINPVILDPSPEMIELWDDCMSFPQLLVQLRRHARITLEYRDETWQHHRVLAEGALSELLQHEVDHLNGVLAVSRAIDGRSFALESQRHLLPGSSFANPSD